MLCCTHAKHIICSELDMWGCESMFSVFVAVGICMVQMSSTWGMGNGCCWLSQYKTCHAVPYHAAQGLCYCMLLDTVAVLRGWPFYIAGLFSGNVLKAHTVDLQSCTSAVSWSCRARHILLSQGYAASLSGDALEAQKLKHTTAPYYHICSHFGFKTRLKKHFEDS